MKVCLYQVRNVVNAKKKIFRYETIILDITESEEGKPIATIGNHDIARSIALAMGWEIAEESRIDQKSA